MGNNNFYIDTLKKQYISWDNLIEKINVLKQYKPYCYEKDAPQVFQQLIVSLLLDTPITLLDGDFSIDEINRLTQNEKCIEQQIDCNLTNPILDKNDLLSTIGTKNYKNWGMTIYTSGTTGLPKQVTHNFDSITRFVKQSPKHNQNVWGFAYNPTHMAGIQVFLQALLNGNTIINLFGQNKEDIFTSIQTHNITNISATSTFYRLLLPYTGSYSSVTRITSGGEKFDTNIQKSLLELMPNAKILNVYASTELGTLFAAEGDIFTVKKELRPLIIINEGELHVHTSLLAKITLKLESEWYSTGDTVEIITEEPLSFKFLARKSEMINTGGYKVNPNEVEDAIRQTHGVNEVRVYGKNNSILGNIIMAEVVRENDTVTEVTIRQNIQTKLQEYKIPRIIKFVEEINLTRTGKIKR